MVSKHQPKHGDHFWQPRYSGPIWRFFIPKWFSPRVFGFATCWQIQSLKKKSWKTRRIDGVNGVEVDGPCCVKESGYFEGEKFPWSVLGSACNHRLENPWKLDPTKELVCAYCADPKVFSGRLRQSGLPKAPFVALLKCVFRCGHNGLRTWKNALWCFDNFWASNQHYLSHFDSGLWFWHGTIPSLVASWSAPATWKHQVNQRRSRFLLQCVQQLRSNLRRVGGELLVAAESPETFLPRLAEGRWKVPSPPSLWRFSLQKWCNKRS